MNRKEILAQALDAALRNGMCEDEGFQLDDEPSRVGYAMSGHYTVDELSMILEDLKRVQFQYDRLCREAEAKESAVKANAAAVVKGRELLAAAIGDRKPIKLYVGRDEGCRCGCGGNYHEQDSVGFKSSLTRLQTMLGKGEAEVDTKDVTDQYVNFTYGDNRAVTIYFS